MNIEDESRIRELFQRLKEEDGRSAPAFTATLDGRRRAGPFAGDWSFRLKLAMSLFLLALLIVPVLMNLDRGPVEPTVEVVVDVLDWESPTDFLLTFSEETLWTSLPTVETEVPQWVGEKYEQ